MSDLPAPIHMTEAVGRTHVGRQRQTNEDVYLTDPQLQLFAVADGMGGHNAGEVASRLVVDTVADFVRVSRSDGDITWPYGLENTLSFEANQLRNAILLANQKVHFEGGRRPECRGMGSTVLAVIIQDSHLNYSSVGDSRLYLMRNGELRQLSVDDSWASSMIRAGADPTSVRNHPMRHALTNALGSGEIIDVKVVSQRLEDGDLLLLCSDGLHGSVGDKDIGDVLATHASQLETAADRLIDAANAAGGPDNVTVVLVRYAAQPDVPPAKRLNV